MVGRVWLTVDMSMAGFIVGYLYIAVHGLRNSKPTITARCKADKKDSKDKHRRSSAHAPANSIPAHSQGPGHAIETAQKLAPVAESSEQHEL